MNSTLRERVKVQRGWKTMKTPLAEGQRIQYNFVKPHMALEGQTPAQAAGVGLGGKNTHVRRSGWPFAYCLPVEDQPSFISLTLGLGLAGQTYPTFSAYTR